MAHLTHCRPTAAQDGISGYLRTTFSFIGLPEVEVIRAEGIAIGPEQRQKSLDEALRQAAELGPV